ncbi:MAG: histidinol-phosphatase [Thermoproteota archaeon]
MVKVNYHIHTTYSDGRATIGEYIKLAVDKGFNEIAFTDHLALRPGKFETFNYSMNPQKMEEYLKAIDEVTSGTVRVKAGLEVDYIPGLERKLREILESYEFDLIIGSVHWVEDICVDCPSHRESLERLVVRTGFDGFYSKYLRLLKMAVDSGLFNIVGHFDVARSWGFKPSNCRAEEFRILERVKETGMVVEVSSKGLRQPLGEAYPSRRILESCKFMDIPVTIGTDAHKLADFDYMYASLMDYIGSLGYRGLALFKRGQVEICDIMEPKLGL